MDHLLRELAPISEAGWTEIENEATRTMRHFLAGRRLVEYRADGSWTQSARSPGRVAQVATEPAGLRIANRASQPLTEMRVDFAISRAELDALDRGATDFNNQPVIDAARVAAEAEDRAVLTGNPAAGIAGIAGSSPHAAIPLDPGFDDFAHTVARAVDLLQEVGSTDRSASPWGRGAGPASCRALKPAATRW